MMKRSAWEISSKNSLIRFKFKWLQISFISGQFSKFYGTVKTDSDFSKPEIYVFIAVNTAETLDNFWNDKLHTKGFLWDDLHPFIEFSSVGGCKQSSGRIWELTGDLNIRGIKKPVTLIVNYTSIKDAYKRHTAEFHLFGNISRKDFELDCSDENGISDEIELNARIYLSYEDL